MRSRHTFNWTTCPDGILQKIIDKCDSQELALLRLVSREFRAAVDNRVERIAPLDELPCDFAIRFPRVSTLDVRNLDAYSCETPQAIESACSDLSHLRELLGWLPRLPRDDASPTWLERLGTLTSLGVKGMCSFSYDKVYNVTALCTSLQRLSIEDCDLSWGETQMLVQNAEKTLKELVLCGIDPCDPEMGLNMAAVWDFMDNHVVLGDVNTGMLETLRLPRMYDLFSIPYGWEEEHGSDQASYEFYLQLAEFTSLKRLDLSGNPKLLSSGLAKLNALSALTSLSLSVTKQSCHQLEQLTLPNLQELVLDDEPQPFYSDAMEGSGIAPFQSLKSLSLANLSLRRPSALELRALSGVTRLSAHHCRMLAAPQVLEVLTQLRVLSVGDSMVPCVKPALLSGKPLDCRARFACENLNSLDRASRALAGLTNLGSLDLKLWRLDDECDLLAPAEDFRWLACLRKLQHLSLTITGSRAWFKPLLFRAASLAHLAPLTAVTGLFGVMPAMHVFPSLPGEPRPIMRL